MDLSYFRSEDFVLGVVVGGTIVGVVVGLLSTSIQRRMDARLARRAEEQRKLSARKRELLKYRCRLAEANPSNRLTMLQRALAMDIRGTANRDQAFTNILLSNIGFLLITALPLPTATAIAAGVLFVFTLLMSAYEMLQANHQVRESVEFIDPVLETMPVAELPLIIPDAALKGFKVPAAESEAGGT